MASLFDWFKRGTAGAQEAVTPAELIRQGNKYLDQGDLEAATGRYQAALAIDAENPRACICLGFVLNEQGRFEIARPHLERAVQLDRASCDAHYLLGLAADALGDTEVAIHQLRAAVELQEGFVPGWCELCRVQFHAGHYDDARAAVDRGLAVDPDSADLLFYLGNLQLHESDAEAAIASYDRVLAAVPEHAEAWSNSGLAAQRLERYEDALARLDQALRIRPDYAEAHFNRGALFAKMRRFDDALTSFGQAIRIQPDYVDAYTQRGLALMGLDQLEEAVAAFDRALAIRDDHTDAHVGRGNALLLLGRFPLAVASFERALAQDPDIPFLLGHAVYARMRMCDWTQFAADLDRLVTMSRRGGKGIQPFAAQALLDDPRLLRQLTETWASQTPVPVVDTAIGPTVSAGSKIRIGYYSADFRLHPVSILMAEVFELHDRSRFEVIGFSFTKGAGGEMTQRLAAAFDRFIDVLDKTDRQVAELSRELGIDIAIDLGGYTTDCRPGIFACRAAPIQVSYIGYLGTMAAPYFDYLLADKVVIPEQDRPCYTEKIVYLPSYQANDSKRRIADRVFKRSELGLPDHGFVFCCFNNSYKINPVTFDSWMRILKRVPASVLLLFAEHEATVPNLRREAERRGVDPDRLVFTGKLPPPEYLARYRVADLFLDTLPYNAGTTASDALWAGLPVLTRMGTTFSGRVAASILTALDLRELITHSAQEYEDLAVALAEDPARLRGVRDRLARNRLTTPLFDSERFTRHLEEACSTMVARHRSGLAPDDLTVAG